MTCPQCGAAIQRGDGRFCSHCGTSLPDRPRITPEEWVTHVERFEQAEQDPQHATARGLPAPDPRLGAQLVPLALFGVLWIAVGAFIVQGFAETGGAIVLFPIVLVGVGVIGMAGFAIGRLRNARAPVERMIAVVVDERTDVYTTGTSDNRSTHTAYYATLQTKDGARVELRTSGGVSGMTTVGDIGLAVMRAGELIDFHRFARI